MPGIPRIREVELRHFDEAMELLRHYSGLRFRQLTIFAGINGGLLFVMFRQAGVLQVFEIYSCAALGILAAMAFLLLELRLISYLDHYRAIVCDYEECFGLARRLYDPRRRGWIARGRLAILLFILSTIGFWVAAALMSARFALA